MSHIKSAFFSVALLLCAAQALGQATPCVVTDHVEYTKKIRENTSESFFSTELVDHLPASSCVPAPDAFFNRIMGAPNALAYTKDINAYMRLLASKSPRVKVLSIGRSEQGREMLAVFVTDESNLARLDDYRAITAKLADPRSLTEAQAGELIANGKPIYWATGSLHSSETGSPEMLMELAYRLAVEETPLIQRIRKGSIAMLTPVVETDGRDRRVDIYLHHKKHPEQRAYPLVWWGQYVAHDNNRDGMSFSLALTRNVLKTFLEWHPTVMHDLHESVPYLYVSSGTGPYNAWLDPIVIAEWQQMANYDVEQMTKRGVVGVWTHGFYDGWASNYMFSIANTHNSIGRFYETFGNGGADTRVRTLRPAATSREWYRPNPPLAKTQWSARDNINMQQSALLLAMDNVATNAQQFLQNFYLKGKRAVAKARQEGPAAWVFPADDPRLKGQAGLLNLLALQGIEVRRLDGALSVTVAAERKSAAATDVSAESKQEPGNGTGQKEKAKKSRYDIPAGSYVVRMDQPYSRLADGLLDIQYYSSKDPRSYDDTGWTLGALKNVKTIRVTDVSILDAPMRKVDVVEVAGAIVGEGATYLIEHNADNALATLRFRLPKIAMEAAEEPFEVDGRKYRAGTCVIRNAERSQLERAAKDLGLKVHSTDAAITVATHPLRAARVGIVHNWTNTQDDGWFRIAFDEAKVPYTYIADTKLRETRDLKSRFDVLILPPMGAGGVQGLSAAIRGLPMRGEPMPWKNSKEMPNLEAPGLDSTEDMRGGLGYTGLANLQQFVSAGGLLLAVQSSASLPVAAGMTEMVNVADAKSMQAPGGVFLSTIDDKKSPITYGYDDQLHVYFRRGPVITITGPEADAGREKTDRASGRGSVSDPDIIQGRAYIPPEEDVKRTPREQELYLPEDMAPAARSALPPPEQRPRAILRFAAEKQLLLSGMLTGGSEIAERPAVVDVPHGKGHIVLFAINPMWRGQTNGSYFLVFNALMNFDRLDVGRSTPPASTDASVSSGAADL